MGPAGAERLVEEAARTVVDDVLSFVTSSRPWSLSPRHPREAPFVARLVLPSPNGAATSAAAQAVCEGTADLAHSVAVGASGQQPAAMGFAEAVAIATAEDSSVAVPVRDGDGAFAPG